MNYVVDSYENYKEENRLTTNNARRIEFVTTTRVLDEIIGTKSKILDCAAGTGIYAFWLADKGHDVTATDITPRHIYIINRTLTNYSSKEEMESIYQRYRLKIVDHLAQDGLAPLLSQKVDKWDENQFKTWCDYHYSVCREQSVLGASNHVIIIGRK